MIGHCLPTDCPKKKVQSILTLPRAPARVASTDAPGSTQNVKRGLKDGTRYDRGGGGGGGGGGRNVRRMKRSC